MMGGREGWREERSGRRRKRGKSENRGSAK